MVTNFVLLVLLIFVIQDIRNSKVYYPTYSKYCASQTGASKNIMYLLTEWEGRTGKYLARGDAVRTELSKGRTNDREPNIFPYGPT